MKVFSTWIIKRATAQVVMIINLTRQQHSQEASLLSWCSVMVGRHTMAQLLSFKVRF